MSSSTVSINYDLSSCKTCITLRTSDNKSSCRIDEILSSIIKKLSRNNCPDNIFLYILLNLLK